MDKVAGFIVKHNKPIVIIFLILTAIGAVLSFLVPVNYNLEDYLPKDSKSTIGIKIMEEEFTEDFPSASIMITNDNILEILECKEKIASLDGVSSLMWLDDAVGKDVLLSTPLEFLDQDIVEQYYKEGKALFSLAIRPGDEVRVVEELYEIIGEDNSLSGSSVNKAVIQDISSTETLNAMIILLPVVIGVLLLTTSSWLEPLLFLITMGVAIGLNMGSNVIFSDISFVTKTVSPILQMAVSLDYAIFLMHSFKEYREEYDAPTAMKKAITKSLKSVSSSAATTVIGFLALVFMRFGIGKDLGLILVKGVALSYLSVMIFLPALTIWSIKILDKTSHKPLNLNLKRFGKGLMSLRIPLLALSILAIVPSFLAKDKIDFEYGMSVQSSNSSRASVDERSIEDHFGKTNQIVVLVPNDNMGAETLLVNDLAKIPGIKSIISYDNIINSSIPVEFVKEAEGIFRSENYSRIILYSDYAEESPETFSAIETIQETVDQYFDENYLAGSSASIYDIRNVVSVDNKVVTLIAVAGIFLVLLIAFKSLSIPLILVLTIESAIWINLAVTYFQDQPLNFIGFLIINTVQLGATVDYAILITDRYMHNRKKLTTKEAMSKSIANNIAAVMTSAVILAVAGLALYLTSGTPIVSELGVLLGRGTLLSFAMVSTVLPALLMLLDFVIRKTTLKHSFYIEKKTRGENK